jgi:hypothetical protein
MVSKISIVGVDDSVCPADLVDISQTFQFVEWGVNLCPEQEQRPGHPSSEWLEELLPCAEDLRLRGILHGRWENDVLEGAPSLKEERPDIWAAFRWLQVDIRKDPKKILTSLQHYPDKIILYTNLEPTFSSRILLPRNKIFTCLDYCGYDLLESDLDWLCQETKKSFWVSIEGFRSDDEITMDLSRVVKFLNRAEDFVTHDSLVKSLRHKGYRI